MTGNAASPKSGGKGERRSVLRRLWMLADLIVGLLERGKNGVGNAYKMSRRAQRTLSFYRHRSGEEFNTGNP